MNQKGFINIAIIIGIVVVTGVAGYFVWSEFGPQPCAKSLLPAEAVNKKTGEKKIFEYPCAVPRGWIITDYNPITTLQPTPPFKGSQDKAWIETDPIQCSGNPWERDWLQSHNNDYSSYPRDVHTPKLDSEEIQIIKNYYDDNYQVTIHDVQSVTFDKKFGEPVAMCEACSCAKGYTLYLLVSNTDTEKMLGLGYKASSYNSQ